MQKIWAIGYAETAPAGKQKPFLFLGAAIVLAWIPWLAAIWLNQGVQALSTKILIAAGGISPTLAALILLYGWHNAESRRGFWKRVFDWRLINYNGIFWIFVYVPLLVAVSIIISTFFGGSFTQFQLIDSVRNNAFLILPYAVFILFFGPLPEELGWRGYGLDGLAAKFNGFTASLILGTVWAIWHIPLFFISGYPLQEHSGESLKVFVFFADLIPKTFIYTYVYFSNNRSILAAILLHFVINLTGSIIEIDAFTEFIQMILMILTAGFLISQNRELFLRKEIK